MNNPLKNTFVALSLALPLLVGCAQPVTGPVAITDVRPATAEERQVRKTESIRDRMGLQSPQSASSMGGATGSPAAHPFVWEQPEGWEALPASSMRLANFKVSENGECYFTVLGGDGGGLAANINRWQQQMNVEPLSEAEIAALPKIALLNQEATLVSIDGAFSGMAGGDGASDYRLLGAALIFMDRAFFVKMTGPIAEIEGQTDNFIAFTASIDLGAQDEDPHAGHDHAPGEHPEEDPHAGHDHAPGEHPEDDTAESVADAPGMLPPGHPEIGGAATSASALPPNHPPLPPAGDDATGLPPGHPEITSGGGAVTGPPPGGADMSSAGSFESSALRWTAPESWQRGPERMMRNVTYAIGDAECYIAILPGRAGGVDANINRWVGQMGNPPLTADAIAALPRIPVLGAEAPMVESEGDFTGMSGETQSNQKLLGVVATVGDQSVFVKMIGPGAVLDAERDNFIEFCKSLHLEA